MAIADLEREDFIGSVLVVIIGRHTPQDVARVPLQAVLQCKEIWRERLKVTIIGSGYVGLVTGACLAEQGNNIFCVDVDPKKIEILNSGGVPIYEPGLKEMIERNRAAGRLQFSTDIAASVAHGDIQFIAVGTPPDEDGSADLQYVVAAARNIGRHMTTPKVIVDKSTVPVGTADKVSVAITEELEKRGLSPELCSFVSNP